MVIGQTDKKATLKTILEVDDESENNFHVIPVPVNNQKHPVSRVKRIFELSKKTLLRSAVSPTVDKISKPIPIIDSSHWSGYLYSPGFGLWNSRGERIVEEQEVVLQEDISAPASSDGDREEEWALDRGNASSEYPEWSNASLEVPLRSFLVGEANCAQDVDVVEPTVAPATVSSTVEKPTVDPTVEKLTVRSPTVDTPSTLMTPTTIYRLEKKRLEEEKKIENHHAKAVENTQKGFRTFTRVCLGPSTKKNDALDPSNKKEKECDLSYKFTKSSEQGRSNLNIDNNHSSTTLYMPTTYYRRRRQQLDEARLGQFLGPQKKQAKENISGERENKNNILQIFVDQLGVQEHQVYQRPTTQKSNLAEKRSSEEEDSGFETTTTRNSWRREKKEESPKNPISETCSHRSKSSPSRLVPHQHHQKEQTEQIKGSPVTIASLLGAPSSCPVSQQKGEANTQILQPGRLLRRLDSSTDPNPSAGNQNLGEASKILPLLFHSKPVVSSSCSIFPKKIGPSAEWSGSRTASEASVGVEVSREQSANVSASCVFPCNDFCSNSSKVAEIRPKKRAPHPEKPMSSVASHYLKAVEISLEEEYPEKPLTAASFGQSLKQLGRSSSSGASAANHLPFTRSSSQPPLSSVQQRRSIFEPSSRLASLNISGGANQLNEGVKHNVSSGKEGHSTLAKCNSYFQQGEENKVGSGSNTTLYQQFKQNKFATNSTAINSKAAVSLSSSCCASVPKKAVGGSAVYSCVSIESSSPLLHTAPFPLFNTSHNSSGFGSSVSPSLSSLSVKSNENLNCSSNLAMTSPHGSSRPTGDVSKESGFSPSLSSASSSDYRVIAMDERPDPGRLDDFIPEVERNPSPTDINTTSAGLYAWRQRQAKKAADVNQVHEQSSKEEPQLIRNYDLHTEEVPNNGVDVSFTNSNSSYLSLSAAGNSVNASFRTANSATNGHQKGDEQEEGQQQEDSLPPKRASVDTREWRQFLAEQRLPSPGNWASLNRIDADSRFRIIHPTANNSNNNQSSWGSTHHEHKSDQPKITRPIIQNLERPVQSGPVSNGYSSLGAGNRRPRPAAYTGEEQQRPRTVQWVHMPDKHKTNSLVEPSEVYGEKKKGGRKDAVKGPGEPKTPIMTVSGRHRCSHCGMELGRGAAMIVESLNLFYHLSCFRCFVCNMALGNGQRGADVRVRGAKLHCQKCFSTEENGIKSSGI